jgi:hypothetical protein
MDIVNYHARTIKGFCVEANKDYILVENFTSDEIIEQSLDITETISELIDIAKKARSKEIEVTFSIKIKEQKLGE